MNKPLLTRSFTSTKGMTKVVELWQDGKDFYATIRDERYETFEKKSYEYGTRNMAETWFVTYLDLLKSKGFEE